MCILTFGTDNQDQVLESPLGPITRDCLNEHSKVFPAAHFLGWKQRSYKSAGSLKKPTLRRIEGLCLSVLSRGCIRKAGFATWKWHQTQLGVEGSA